MVKFYIASGWENKAQVRQLAKLLTAQGWEWAYDWTQHKDGDDLCEIANAEVDAIKASDILIALLPGGYGTHVEIGAALGAGKQVVLYAAAQDDLEGCIGYLHPNTWWLVGKSLVYLADLRYIWKNDGGGCQGR